MVFFKYNIMDLPIIVYGDSFSTPGSCQSRPEEMWFRFAWPNSPVMFNRSRPQHNIQGMFLEATHDAITRTEPTRLVVTLGLVSRLPRYEDGWYDREMLTDNRPEDGDPATLEDASRRLKSVVYSDLEGFDAKTSIHLMDMLHPTLLWGRLFQDVIGLGALCGQRGHELVVLHMSHKEQEYYDRHVLLAPLYRGAQETGSYWHFEHSCTRVCESAGILPWDHHIYGVGGHHGPEGQEYFGRYMRDLLRESGQK
jgi:hypothetical protein